MKIEEVTLKKGVLLPTVNMTFGSRLKVGEVRGKVITGLEFDPASQLVFMYRKESRPVGIPLCNVHCLIYAVEPQQQQGQQQGNKAR